MHREPRGTRRLSDLRIRAELLAATLRWRVGACAAMFVCAVAGVGAATFGFVYLSRSEQSVLVGTLGAASPADIGLTLLPASSGPAPLLSTAARNAPRPGSGSAWFGAPIATRDTGLTVNVGNQPFAMSLVSRTGACSHLRIVEGTCPRSAGSVILSTRTARELQVAVGQQVVGSSHPATASPLTVVGLYAPGDPQDPFWWANNYFPFGFGSPTKPFVDAAFAQPQTVAAAAPESAVSSMVQVPFRPASLKTEDVGRIGAAIQAYEHRTLDSDAVDVSTHLPSVLMRYTATRDSMTRLIAVIDGQLVLLALFVLYFVSTRTADEREPDIVLAALRGYTTRQIVAVALAEPFVVVLAAVPVGILVGWFATWVLAPHLFLGGTGASLTLWGVGAGVATGLAGLLSIAIGARRLVRNTEAGFEETSSGGGPRPMRWQTAGDVAAVAVAVAAFAQLAVGGVSDGGTHTDPLAALAPGLVALGLGVVGARLLPRLLRFSIAATPTTGHVGWGLAVRRVARRREFAPQVVLLSVAVGLASFAISGWAIANRNRDIKSAFDAGATKVLTVSVPPGVGFLRAVRSADRGGTSAMAAVVESAPDGTTLAVDSSRLTSVMSWPPGLGAGGADAAARGLRPPGTAPSVLVSGDELSLTVDTATAPSSPPELTVDLFDTAYQTPEQVYLGPLVLGTSSYSGSLRGLCPSGCLLTDVGLLWSPPPGSPDEEGMVDFTVSAIATVREHGAAVQVRAGLVDPRRWTSANGVRLQASSAGLHVQANLNPYAYETKISPADVPAAIPAVFTAQAWALSAGAGVSVIGLDGATLSGRSVGIVPALPRVGASGALVDLQLAERYLSGPFAGTTTEVWLNNRAPSDFVERLAGTGISVVSVDSTRRHQAELARSGIALAYTLFLVSAIAAIALAVGAVGFAVVAGGKRRLGELATMRLLGVGPGALRRSLQLEQLLVVTTGALVGAAGGLGAVAVAIRSVPEFVSVTPGPPLLIGLPGSVLAFSLLALVLSVGLTVAASASAVVAAASVERLGAQT